MPRLVTFGCSYTFGVGLEDVHPRFTGEPSALAWPKLLANKLELNSVNLGFSGSGNKEITNTILNQQFLPDDLIIINWSHFSRYDFFRFNTHGGYRMNLNDHNYKSLLKGTDVISEDWKYDNAIQNYLIVEFVHMYLTKHKVNFYSVFSIPDFGDYHAPKFLDQSKVIRINKPDYFIDFAKDKRHFGPKSHEILAELLYNNIRK